MRPPNPHSRISKSTARGAVRYELTAPKASQTTLICRLTFSVKTPIIRVMTPDLRDEIQQKKPFTSLQQEAQLSVIRTGSLLMDSFERLLKPYGITAAQFNVLRILRGAEPEGLCRNELRDRLLTRMPDVTRMLDRMVEAGFVERGREGDDRRKVRTRITAKARELVDKLDDVVEEEHERRFGQVGKKRLRKLIETLTEVRQNL